MFKTHRIPAKFLCIFTIFDKFGSSINDINSCLFLKDMLEFI